MSNLLAPFQLLELNVISAQDLAPVARSMRTYAVAWVDQDRKLSTRVDSEGQSNPTWNDKFVFRVDEEFLHDETSTITIEIYALHWYKDVHVGTVRARIAHLLPPPSTKGFHNNHPPAEMRFVALQVRRPSGRPQGILNVGATVLDSSMRSMPLYSHDQNGGRDGYDEEAYERAHDHDQFQSQHHFHKELRRVKSDSSSMVNSELAQQNVINQKGERSPVLSSSELSLKPNQNGYPMASPMVSGRSGSDIKKGNENYGREYISDGAIDSDDDEDGVAVAKGEAGESEVTHEHRGIAMESIVMDPPLHKKRESLMDSSEDENEIGGARLNAEQKHNKHEKKLSQGTLSGSSRRGTPLHPMASASPQHRMSAMPRHGNMGTPQHPMSGATPRHRLAGVPQPTVSGNPRHRMSMALTPQHPLSSTSRQDKARMFGTPQHEKAGIFATMRHEKARPMFGTPQHEKAGIFATTRQEKARMFGTPQHEKAGMFATPRHEMARTPMHEKFGTPRHEKLGGTPRHQMAGTPRHAMAAATPRHAMAGTPLHHRLGSGTPLHPMSGTPLRKRSVSNEIVGKPGTPLHGMSFTKFIEFEPSRKSNVMGGGNTITDSELGPSPSEVAAAVAKAPRDYDDHENSIVGDWTMDDRSVEGLQSKLERWKTELPPVYDNSGVPSSMSRTTTSRSAGKRSGRKKSAGLFSCFSNICGLQCTIVVGGSGKKKGKNKGSKVAENASSEVTSYL